RRTGLAERGVASDADLDDARNGARVASAALREARAELTQAQDDLAKKIILAPFSGVLRSFDVEVGEYTRDGDRLGELLDLSAARVKLGLSDREVVAVSPGQPVVARVDARPGETFAGEVLRVGAASDPETRKFPVEVELPNPEGRLLPGMVATVELVLGAAQQRTLIPAEAAVDEFGLRFVWVIETTETGQRVARRRRIGVRAVPFQPDRVEVLSGLSEGEEIALTATRQLTEGERVLTRANGKGAP
ncbi:MAG: efflux RND transporter periplasmic adaptor subunit, partial [Myxococcales bacterium]|nr:efflux RND transporter periplasmic adaptor subunit [Myxococcales bacterium]